MFRIPCLILLLDSIVDEPPSQEIPRAMLDLSLSRLLVGSGCLSLRAALHVKLGALSYFIVLNHFVGAPGQGTLFDAK